MASACAVTTAGASGSGPVVNTAGTAGCTAGIEASIAAVAAAAAGAVAGSAAR